MSDIARKHAIEQVISQLDIHALFCAFLRNVDERNFDLLPSYFTLDAVFRQYVSLEERDAQRPVSVATGHTAIVDQFKRFFRLLDRTHHSITNFVTQVDGDTANISAHMRCYHRGTGPSSGLWEESLSLLQGTVVRQNEPWRIRTFEYTVAIILGLPDVFGDAAISTAA